MKGDKWGDETSTMFGIAHELGKHSPVVTVLANGGNIAKQEVLQSVRHRWPVVVITGTGQLADTLADWWRHKTAKPFSFQRVLLRTKTTLPISDRDIAEIINAGDIYLFSCKDKAEELRALLKYLFHKQEKKVLAQITERETFYAHLTGEHQKVFKRHHYLF